jgi:hypothetical protein
MNFTVRMYYYQGLKPASRKLEGKRPDETMREFVARIRQETRKVTNIYIYCIVLDCIQVFAFNKLQPFTF